ncbi:fructokinase [Oceaniferula spumae]|uniref:fructokinase n=1 Tax=Oceaniferula spumae TaxID=2979115 RepID=A0AAT9FR47_9BACT
MMQKLLGGVEAGGTKMVCAVAHEPNTVLDEVRFATTGPDETLARVTDYFQQAVEKFGPLDAIGYGTFGPACITMGDAKYGHILNTPKAGWQGCDVLAGLSASFPNAKLSFDTDVNAAAIGEGAFGAARDHKNFIYITVGTGIGGGVIINGKPLHSEPHAEIGHMLVPMVDGELEEFAGSCKFHGCCLEGLASGTAIGQRWGGSSRDLSEDHVAWDIEARYLAVMVQNLIACYAPGKIILGGGVMEQCGLLGKIKTELAARIGDYWQLADDLLVLPQLGNQAGITGALLMASTA